MTLGRPQHQPPDWTPQQWVMRMSWFGMPNKRIAELMEIDEKTLVKHYGPELEEGRSYRNVRLAEMAYTRAMNPDDRDSAKLLQFVLSHRGGWSSTQKTELSGPNGGPMVSQFVDAPPKETREEWLARRARELANPVAAELTVTDDSD